MDIHKRIESIMMSKNLNYRSLGSLIDYSDTQTRNVVIGKSIPKIDFIQNLVRVFPEIDIDWLITGREKKKDVTIKNNLTDYSIEEIITYLFKNKEVFKENTAYNLLMENELKDRVIETLEKEKQKFLNKKTQA